MTLTRTLPLVAALLLSSFSPPPARAEPDARAVAEPDPRAVAVGKAMWQALGGDAGWNQARYLRFDFVVERGGKRLDARAHYWDRFSGRYRVEGTEQGKPWRVYFNVNDKTGVVFLDGKKVTDAALTKKWLEDAYGAFINDSYWLLAPYKLFDKGVSLTYAGEETGPKGEPCDVLKLSFAAVGLTPKDVYWQLVDKKTHLLAAWKFVLEGQKAVQGKPATPSLFAWEEWQKVGPIELAMARSAAKPKSGPDNGIGIRFDHVAVAAEVDEAALAVPPQ